VDLGCSNVHCHPYGGPLAWTRSYGNGAMFFSARGHEEVVWWHPRFRAALHNAMLWATAGALR
jgi:uncharacterized protein